MILKASILNTTDSNVQIPKEQDSPHPQSKIVDHNPLNIALEKVFLKS